MKSMTGFGKAAKELSEKKITVEVRSLNSKQLDLNMRLPSTYEKELEFRSLVSKALERGKIDFFVSIELTEAAAPVSINKPLAKTYHTALQSIAKECGEENQPLLPLIIKMPDILQTQKAETSEAEWKQLTEAINLAIEEIDTSRVREGKLLYNEFINRINTITTLLEAIENTDEQRVTNVKKRIRKNIDEHIDKNKIDENRLEQELIYYLEKIDITEEKVRLKMHCDYFLKTAEEPSAGRKLGFISQEIGREINTIGSKANDANIQKMVVQMKDELEKIKEQLLNIL